MEKIQKQTEKMHQDAQQKIQESIKREDFKKDLHTKEVSALNDAVHSLKMEQESIRAVLDKKNDELHQLEIAFTKSKISASNRHVGA